MGIIKKHRWLVFPVVTVAVMILGGGIIITILGRGLPRLTTLESIEPPVVSKIVSRDGVVLDELHSYEKRIWVPIERMPQHLIQAVIATEDRRFFDHWGLDIRRIVKAAMVDIAAGYKKQGAGTITGQLARDIFLTKSKKWSRKIQEAITAVQIERTYSKTEILEMYLNQMFYGHRAYGIQSAAQRYFGKNVDHVTVEEAAFLIGVLQLPAMYSPYRHPEQAVRRRNVVLYSMMVCGHLTQAEYDSLRNLPLDVIETPNAPGAIAPYFCDFVRQEMEKKYGIGIYTDGLTIRTSLDSRIQAFADSVVRKHMPGLERQIWNRLIRNRSFLDWMDPRPDSEEEIHAFLTNQDRVDSLFRKNATVQVAMVAIEPATGHILALIGGRDFTQSSFNRAVQAVRQPGSAFKPIVYTAAIDNGFAPSTELMNTNVTLFMPDGTRWTPQNYDLSVGGLTTLREGLRLSLNLVSVHLVQELIKPSLVVSYAKRFGFTTQINPYDAIALGADGVIPLELTSAFSVFANRGVRVEPLAVTRVEDKDGKLIEETAPRRREVISENTAYIMTDILSTVVSEGTGRSARSTYNFYRPAGGKTGTTNDFTDAWFQGFTPQIAAGFWVGFDNPAIRLGERMSGAVVALPMWAPFMRMVYDSLRWPLADFAQPQGVVRARVCAETKKLASESCPKIWDEIFFRELAPTDKCELHASPHTHPAQQQQRSVF